MVSQRETRRYTFIGNFLKFLDCSCASNSSKRGGWTERFVRGTRKNCRRPLCSVAAISGRKMFFERLIWSLERRIHAHVFPK